jgi:hypothetical protein
VPENLLPLIFQRIADNDRDVLDRKAGAHSRGQRAQ